MADVEIVIKMPEEMWERVKVGYVPIGISKYLKNGILLPNGHGRIGDLDALETEMVNGIRAGNYEEGYEVYAHINDMDDCVDCVRYADTIIEADEENDNADSNQYTQRCY